MNQLNVWHASHPYLTLESALSIIHAWMKFINDVAFISVYGCIREKYGFHYVLFYWYVLSKFMSNKMMKFIKNNMVNDQSNSVLHWNYC